ncbi:hypothetical protein [Halomonas cibimaris]|uniref:hypothetical protein n=1 Tax=Halomonas cibimaris TaxID=657012 RepID=UPI0031DAB471
MSESEKTTQQAAARKPKRRRRKPRRRQSGWDLRQFKVPAVAELHPESWTSSNLRGVFDGEI